MPMDNVTLENTQQSISSRDAKSVASVMVNGKWVNLSDTLEQANVKSDVGTVAKQVAAQQEVVSNAVSVADSAQSAADAAVASAQVTSDAVSAIASATAEAKQGANDALSRAKSAWDVATNAKSAVTDFDPLLKSAQSDASNAIAQIADTASALSDAKAAFTSDVAVAKNLASTAQTTADNAVKSASSVANDLTAVASQAKSNADGITKVTSDVGLLQTTVADNSGNISTIQETAKQIQQAVSDNAGNITVAKQTADSAATVASDARSNATVAIQTASQASITAKNASGQAASAVITASGAMTTASNAKSDATVAVQTASGASLTAINANSDATVAKQTASEAKVQASNAESDFAQLSIRAGQIEASVATNSGAIASVQQTANGLTTTVGKVDDRVKKIEDTTNWTTKTGALDMDTLTTTQNIYYRDTNLKNADGEAGWAYIQVVSMGERVTQTVWHDRSSIQHTRTGAVSGSSYNWDAWNRTATNAQISNLTQSLDGLRSTVATKADQSEVTQLSNLIQAKVSSGDFTSTTTQLKNMINQRVQVGDVISQINQEAGGNTLIQVSNGKGSLILNAANTVITGKAWIPVAAIADLTADQIQAGTLKGVKVDFRDSTGTGMIADGSTLTFDVSNTPAGYLSYNGMPVAELPDGSGGNELAIRYGLSTAIIPADNSGAQATFSKAAQKIAYMTGTSQGKQMLSGLEVHSNNHHWLCAVNSDATCNRFEVNDRDGLNIAWHDNTHFFISDGNAKLYQDNNDSQTATKLEIHGWAWVNGWVEAAGHSQHSTLSSKTRIEEADPNHMLDLVNNTELTTFAFKSEVAEGTEARHIGPIIDDVNDVAQYRMPAEFIAPTKTARDDDNMIGALFGAVQALTKRIKALESKVG